MSVKTILLDFKLRSANLRNFIAGVLDSLQKRSISQMDLLSASNNRSIYANADSVLTISFAQEENQDFGTVCINFESILSNSQQMSMWPQSNFDLQLFHDDLKALTSQEQSPNFMPFLVRGSCHEISPYLTTSDDRLIEYGFQEVLFNGKSDYQSVQIVKTVDHGNVLILDGAVNLAEKDTEAYTKSLMNIPKDKSLYQNANILILGGGDGGLLKTILDETQPNQVTMVDLDEMVMEACSAHMKSVCGPYLDKDKRKGDNYHVITGDAIQYMEDHENNEYDIIFGDLTDVPVDTGETAEVNTRNSVFSSTVQDEAWTFIGKVVSMALQRLKPGQKGRFYTHCNGKSVPAILEKYQDMLNSVVISKNSRSYKCQWSKSQAFVPSFMEVWVFYQVSLIEADQNNVEN